MPTADKLQPENRLMALFVGESGSGKSCAAAFLPGKIKWMALTKRVYGIMGHPLVKGDQELLKNIDITFYDTKGGFKAIDDDLEMLLNAGPNLRYKTIVIEDFTTASDLLQDDAFKFTGMLKNAQGQSSSWHKKLGNVDLPGLDEFAYEDKAFKDITLALNALPCNIICMVHWADRYEVSLDGSPKVSGRKISLRNATIPKIMKWFNEVWFFEKKIKIGQIKEDGVGKTIQIPEFHCTFTNDLARTCFPELPYSIEWTNRNFWEIVSPKLKLQEEVKKC
jgi:hypothetical protein